MTEGLFVLTVIFVAYVVYQVMNDKKGGEKAAASKPGPVRAAAPKPQPETKKEAKEVKTEAAPVPIVESAPPVSEPAAKSGIRNPDTGEVTPPFTNYRFAKRWIKEALVAEGLLDKIYKNNELDAAAEARIKDAVAKLEKMPKYKV